MSNFAANVHVLYPSFLDSAFITLLKIYVTNEEIWFGDLSILL